MKLKSTITPIFLAILAGVVFWRKCKGGKDTGEISLENIRRGIANGWYSAQLFAAPDESGTTHYYVILTGKDTDGNEEQSTEEISKKIFLALKADGVPELV